MTKLERREFLKLGVAAASTAVALKALPARAGYSPASVGQIAAMSPQDMAEASGAVMTAWDNILKHAAAIRNPAVRKSVLQILANPAPTFMGKIQTAEKKDIYRELQAKNLIDGVSLEAFLPPIQNPSRADQPFYSAPGSGYQSHHSYPGGLATHTDLNVRVSMSLADNYLDVYDYLLDKDTVIASQLLHDMQKPWVFQWQKNGESRTENKLAGTGEHHVLGVAESIHRGLPAEICIAQACAHNHPRTPEDEAKVVGWLTAASIIAGVDPVKHGLLEKGGKTLPLPRRQEGFVCHLGDHDWVLTVPAAKWTIPLVKRIAVRDYNIKENDTATFNKFRNYIFSQATIMSMYELYAKQGEHEVLRTINALVTPA